MVNDRGRLGDLVAKGFSALDSAASDVRTVSQVIDADRNVPRIDKVAEVAIADNVVNRLLAGAGAGRQAVQVDCFVNWDARELTNEASTELFDVSNSSDELTAVFSFITIGLIKGGMRRFWYMLVSIIIVEQADMTILRI